MVPITTTDALTNTKVAANAKGQLVAAWNQGTGVIARVQKKNKPWGLAKTLDPASSLVALAEAADNTALVLMRNAGGTYATSVYTGTTWGTSTPIPSTPGWSVYGANASFNGQTVPTATLIWVEGNGVNPCAVKAALFTNSGGWGTPVTIASNSACFDLVDLAINKTGEAALALGSTRSRFGARAGSLAFVASRNKAGIWTGLTDLGPGTYQTQPHVAIADTGVAIAVLSDANLGVQWSRRSPVDGSWSARAIIDGAVPAVETDIAMDAKGNAMVVYPSYYTNVPPAVLQSARLRSGSNVWSTPITVTDPATSAIVGFQIAVTPAGNFVAGWVDNGLAHTAPANATAAMGVSTWDSVNLAWTNTILGWDYTFTSPTPDTVAVAAATGTAVAMWNAEEASNTYQTLSLATASAR